MTKKELEKIKNFAMENMEKDAREQIFVLHKGLEIVNPWYDATGRFELNDDQAVKTYGLDLVTEFCEKANEKMRIDETPVLCGFIWKHGEKDYSVYEVQLAEKDREAIEEILQRYETDGTSIRNCYDLPFSEVISEC